MEVPYSLEFHGTYVQIIHPPGFVASLDSVENMWTHFAALCDRYNCRQLLVEAPGIKSQLETMTAFDAGRNLAAINPGITVAFCLDNYEVDEAAKFFKTVAQNRGVKVEYFVNINDARDWLGANADDQPE